VRNESSTADGSSRAPATPGSMTRILEFIDPTLLPPRAQSILRVLGPFLADGLNQQEIATRCGRSTDWVKARLHELRMALVEAALVRADEMERDLREHLEALRSSTA